MEHWYNFEKMTFHKMEIEVVLVHVVCFHFSRSTALVIEQQVLDLD